jgi:hypothetical protein
MKTPLLLRTSNGAAAPVATRRFRAAWSSFLATTAVLAAKSGLLAGLPW